MDVPMQVGFAFFALGVLVLFVSEVLFLAIEWTRRLIG